MADPEKNTVEVVGEHEEDLAANAVDVFVAIQGSSILTGRAALTKAREVAALVEALAQVGIPEQAIDLESVRVEVKNGLLGRNSAALYQLRLRIEALDKLPAVLGVVSSAPQAKLESLHWQYPDDEVTEGRLLALATRRARAKARAIAAALDCELSSVHTAQEVRQHESSGDYVHLHAPKLAMRSRGGGDELTLGLEIQHRCKVRCEVKLICLLGGAASHGERNVQRVAPTAIT